MVCGIRSQTGQRLPAIRCFMDAHHPSPNSLYSLYNQTPQKDLLAWAHMKIKPKSHSLSIQKGTRSDTTCFTVDGERLPLLVEEPVRSFGRLYTADLSDKSMASAIISQFLDGLRKIDQWFLPGKFKVWCCSLHYTIA